MRSYFFNIQHFIPNPERANPSLFAKILYMLLPRILTAVIGVPLILAAIHFGGLVYMAFVAGVTLLCLYEYGLVLRAGKKPVHILSLMIFGLLMAAVAMLGRAQIPSLELPDTSPFVCSLWFYWGSSFEY